MCNTMDKSNPTCHAEQQQKKVTVWKYLPYKYIQAIAYSIYGYNVRSPSMDPLNTGSKIFRKSNYLYWIHTDFSYHYSQNTVWLFI